MNSNIIWITGRNKLEYSVGINQFSWITIFKVLTIAFFLLTGFSSIVVADPMDSPKTLVSKSDSYGIVLIDSLDAKARFFIDAIDHGNLGSDGEDPIELVAIRELTDDLDLLIKWANQDKAFKLVFGLNIGKRSAEEVKIRLIEYVENSKGVLVGSHEDLEKNHDLKNMLLVFRKTLIEARKYILSVNMNPPAKQ